MLRPYTQIDYAPVVPITSQELFDVCINWVSKERYEKAGFKLRVSKLDNLGDRYVCFNVLYGSDHILNEVSISIYESGEKPILFTANKIENIERASKSLSRLLGLEEFGGFKLVSRRDVKPGV